MHACRKCFQEDSGDVAPSFGDGFTKGSQLDFRRDQGNMQDGAKVWCDFLPLESFIRWALLTAATSCWQTQSCPQSRALNHEGCSLPHLHTVSHHLTPLPNLKSHCSIKTRSTMMAPLSTLPCWIHLKWDLLVLSVTVEANRIIKAKFFSSEKKTLFHLSMFPVRCPLAKSKQAILKWFYCIQPQQRWRFGLAYAAQEPRNNKHRKLFFAFVTSRSQQWKVFLHKFWLFKRMY